ncbi:MAG: DNA-binding NarL/FixJ family response regulator, partial [Polaribacter sp.]
MINILIADDHKVFRDGIVSIMDEVADINVIAEAKDGKEVLEELKEVSPDVVLMDISMGGYNGIETTQFISKEYPNIKVLVLSMHNESNYIIKTLEAGAIGYLLKDAGSTEMIKAIREVASGNTYYSQQVSALLVEQLRAGKKRKDRKTDIPLTRRELEVLQLIVEENTNSEIAKALFISIRTVDTHRRNLIEKVGVK